MPTCTGVLPILQFSDRGENHKTLNSPCSIGRSSNCPRLSRDSQRNMYLLFCITVHTIYIPTSTSKYARSSSSSLSPHSLIHPLANTYLASSKLLPSTHLLRVASLCRSGSREKSRGSGMFPALKSSEWAIKRTRSELGLLMRSNTSTGGILLRPGAWRGSRGTAQQWCVETQKAPEMQLG